MARTESITDDLRRDILAGQFPPGERLVELLLTDRYKCGRAAVRSALLELATEGLVDREANRGATVRRISIAEAIEITEARAALEGLIAAGAARRATAQERVELTEIVAAMRAAVRTGDHDHYSDLNTVLHGRLREISQHAIASHLVQNLRNRASHHQYRLAKMAGRAAESLGQHQAIVDAVVAGDATEAAAAMDRHLHSVVDALNRWSDRAVRPGPETP